MKTKFHYYFILALALAFSAPKANAQTVIQFWDFNNTEPSGGGADSLGTPFSYANAADTTTDNTFQLRANYSASGTALGHIVYIRPTTHYSSYSKDSILDNGSGGDEFHYDYSNTNDTLGSEAGNLFIRARNPTDSCEMWVYIPTTGYKNIQMHYVIETSATNAPDYNIFSFSTNGGTTWHPLTTPMDTFNTGGRMHPDTLCMDNPTTGQGTATTWYPVQIDFSDSTSINNNANFILKWRIAGPNSVISSHNDRYDNIAILGTSIAPTGINEVSAQEAGYNVYPNPTSDMVTISTTSTYKGAKLITLYNVVGQSVSTTESYDRQINISTSALNAGVYFVEIKEVATGNKYTTKLIKQ